MSTNYPKHIAEMALAHTISSAVERAYRRGDLFDKRAELMRAWARYCYLPPSKADNVTPLRRGRSEQTDNCSTRSAQAGR